jgi:hypothetical protein
MPKNSLKRDELVGYFEKMKVISLILSFGIAEYKIQ